MNLDGEIYFAPAGDETNLEYSDCFSFITNQIDLPFDDCCSGYMKNFICDLIIAIAVRNNLHDFDPRVRQMTFKTKRKRGDEQ